MSFDINTIKPWLTSTTVKGGITAVVGSVIGIVAGAQYVGVADDVYKLAIGAVDIAASVTTLWGGVQAIIGRFKATTKIG